MPDDPVRMGSQAAHGFVQNTAADQDQVRFVTFGFGANYVGYLAYFYA